MINGIGPGSQVRSNIAYAAYYNNVALPEKEKAAEESRSARKESKDKSSEKLLPPVTRNEIVQKGAFVIATNHNLSLFLNF